MTSKHAVLSVVQMYEADSQATVLGVESFALMRSAGEAVARAVAERWSPRPVCVLCGPGSNGGDGYVAARALSDAGWPVSVLALGEPAGGDAATARGLWQGEVRAISEAAVGGAQLVIDALFGAGLTRPLPPDLRALLEGVERRGTPIVAVDLPSGLPGDAPEPLAYAPQAALTVTFHRKKPAHILCPASELCGEVVVADIGIPQAATPDAQLWENHPDLWLHAYPWPKPGTHKHARGRLGVVGGKQFDTGAARLAARAGLRTAGTVRVYCPPEAAPTYAAHLEAAMLKPFEDADELYGHAREMDAFVIGPASGVGEATRANLQALARTDAALVADADALTSFRDEPQALFALLDGRDVITPHPGEFDRIFPGLLNESRDRIAAARTAAERAGCVVLLKGSDTVVAAPNGRAVVNTHATPWLATAGSGDVLCGVIGGLLAGGMDAFEAACAGAWMHGDAGRRFGVALTAEDLPGLLPAVIAELFARA